MAGGEDIETRQVHDKRGDLVVLGGALEGAEGGCQTLVKVCAGREIGGGAL